MFARLKQDHKEKRTSALKFANVQISIFKHSTGLSDIYHDQMDSIKQASTNILMRNAFNEHFVQSLPVLLWPSQPACERRKADERPELFWSSFPVP